MEKIPNLGANITMKKWLEVFFSWKWPTYHWTLRGGCDNQEFGRVTNEASGKVGKEAVILIPLECLIVV